MAYFLLVEGLGEVGRGKEEGEEQGKDEEGKGEKGEEGKGKWVDWRNVRRVLEIGAGTSGLASIAMMKMLGHLHSSRL